MNLNEYLSKIHHLKFGEVLINSIDRDGTGIGLDFEPLNLLPNNFYKPIILSGGCGNADHIDTGIKKRSISAISTANLLNFVETITEVQRTTHQIKIISICGICKLLKIYKEPSKKRQDVS